MPASFEVGRTIGAGSIGCATPQNVTPVLRAISHHDI